MPAKIKSVVALLDGRDDQFAELLKFRLPAPVAAPVQVDAACADIPASDIVALAKINRVFRLGIFHSLPNTDPCARNLRRQVPAAQSCSIQITLMCLPAMPLARLKSVLGRHPNKARAAPRRSHISHPYSCESWYLKTRTAPKTFTHWKLLAIIRNTSNSVRLLLCICLRSHSPGSPNGKVPEIQQMHQDSLRGRVH